MITISVRSNVNEVAVHMRETARNRIPQATAKALTATAAAIRTAEIEEIKKVFDRPNPWTQRAVLYTAAKPGNLTTTVFLREGIDSGKGNAPSDYLRAQIEGGRRKKKRFELALQYAGILPPDMYAVPGERAQMDQYGNMRQSQIVQILSALKAFKEVGYLANRTKRSAARKKRAEYFVGRPSKGEGPLGIWQRVGTGARPILIFVKAPIYKPRFDFYGVARRTGAGFDAYFAAELATTLKLAA